MSTTGDLTGLAGNELDGDVDADFDELARRAGAALRRPAPEDGVRAIAARQRHQQALKATVIGGVAVVALVGTLVVLAGRDDSDNVPPVDSSPTTLPATTTPSPTISALVPIDSSPDLAATTTVAEELSVVFSGNWTSTDTDGSAQTMTITTTGDGSAQMTLHDAAAGAMCAGAAATVTGNGELNGGGELIITTSNLSCDDGSQPAGELSYSFTHDRESDTLTDNLGAVWLREGPDGATAEPVASGSMWPQSSVDEVRDAQALADAGDPNYSWQVDPQLSSEEWALHLRQSGSGIVERFLQEELGWDEFLFNPHQGDYGCCLAPEGNIRGVVYIRCAPGETNPLYPTAETGDALGSERCAPTIDELHYEAVSLDLAQLDRQGRDGLWVVSRWAAAAPFTQADPRVVEADATERLDDFLQARIDGDGAENLVEVYGLSELDEVPLLYATTTGAPYERFEIERTREPQWPYGWMGFTVRLFANGGTTVVEQEFSWRDGSLVFAERETTENGQPLPAPYSFLDGEVTAFASSPWEGNIWTVNGLSLGSNTSRELVQLTIDPLPVATGCAGGAASADAAALAQAVVSDPDLDATAPIAVTVGGVEGLQIDVVQAPGATTCADAGSGSTLVLTKPTRLISAFSDSQVLGRQERMRLYLIDLPEGSTGSILAIAIVASETRFEAVIEAATPIIESIAFHSD
jgi:hypothetical protein